MESINFIPSQQKKHQVVNKSSKKLSYPNLIGSFVLIVIIFGVGLWSLQVLWLETQIQELEQVSKDLDATYGEIYPGTNLATTIGVASELAAGEYPIEEVLPEIRGSFLGQLTLNTLVYSKQSKVIRISVELDSFESVVAQVDAFQKLDSVREAEYSNISSTGENNEQSAEITLTLQ